MKVIWQKRDMKHTNLFYKFFFSFLFFLLIPILLFTAMFYNGILRYSEETVKEANMAKLQLTENNSDTILVNARNNALSLIRDDTVKPLFALDANDISDNFDNVSKVLNAYGVFDNMIENNKSVNSIYIYIKNSDSIISSEEGAFKRADFYDTDWIEPYRKNDLAEDSLTGLRTRSNANSNNKTSIVKVITYIMPFQYMQTDGLIAINITGNSFSENFVSSLKDKEESYIAIDGNGKVVYERNNQIENFKALGPKIIRDVTSKYAEDSGSSYFIENNKKYLVMFRRSSVSGLTFIDIILMNSVFDKIFFFKSLIAVSILLMLIVGIFISYFLSEKLYNPVKNVLDNLKNQIMIDPRYKRNELLIISDAINELVANNLEADKKIEMNRQVLKESYIMSLLMGKADESDANDSLDNSCCCILLSIDRFDMFSAHYSYREQYYYKSLVVKVCNQVIALYTKGAGAIMESDKIALVVSAGSDAGDSFHQMLQTICNRIIDELSVIHDFTISIGVGGIYDNKDSVRKSYLEASKALKYRLLFGYNCVITYAEICDFTNSFSYPIEEENHIMNNLRQNSSQEIFEAIEKIIGEFNLFKTKKINYEIVMHCVTKLVNKTLEYLASSYISVADIFGENYDVYYEFTGIETLSDLKQWLEFFYERIITYQQLYTHNADENKHYKDIVQFIQSSYMDSNLCIEAIADKLNLSYSHVRRIFKSFSGVNFVDYLNKIRIANAKEMLLKTDCTIKDIANQSGYNNDQCLTRFFKRYEGVTPGKYRANWQDDIAKPNHRMS